MAWVIVKWTGRHALLLGSVLIAVMESLLDVGHWAHGGGTDVLKYRAE